MVKGLAVGDEVIWVVGNHIKGKLELRRFPVTVLALPSRTTAQIECQLNGKAYKTTVSRTHLEPVAAPQVAVARAVKRVLKKATP